MIHTVGPIWNGGRNREEEILANCYFNCMKLAMNNEIRSITFPSISMGVYSFSVELEAKIAVHTVNRFLQDNPDSFDLVECILFDTYTESVYEAEIDKSKNIDDDFMRYTCIYCKDEKEFNREHVVPRMMGRYTDGLVLSEHQVCQEHNSYFSKNTEDKIGLDLYEVLLRMCSGIKK